MPKKEMRKIVLYNPCPQKGEIVRSPSIALLSLVSLLWKDYDVKIHNHDEQSLEEEIIKNCGNAVCLGIGAMTGNQIKDGLRICKIVRNKFPKLPIVWGGWHVSILPKQSLENDYVDIIVIGQGPRTFYELVKTLDNKRNLINVNGIGYKKNGEIVLNEPRVIEDLNNFPSAPYHLIDESRLINNLIEVNTRSIEYHSSQGCSGRCGFCADRIVYQGKYVSLNPERVIKDLKELKKRYNINGVCFVDTNFFLDEKRVIGICKGIIKEKLNIKWGMANGRVDNLLNYADSTFDLLRESGLISFFVGAESGLQKELDMINKDTTIEQVIEFAKICKKHRLNVHFSFILGMPLINSSKKEDWKVHLKEEVDALVDITNKLLDIDKDSYLLYLTYVLYPNTLIFERAVKMGYKPPQSFEEWGEFDHNISDLSWFPKKYATLSAQFTVLYIPILNGLLYKKAERYGALKFVFNPIIFLLCFTVKLRWKLKFFDYPFEYHILKNIKWILRRVF